MEEIEAELAALARLSGKASGRIRVTATEDVTRAVLTAELPKLARTSDIKVEIIRSGLWALTGHRAQRSHAGVRDGRAKWQEDMIAVRIASQQSHGSRRHPITILRKPTTAEESTQELVEQKLHQVLRLPNARRA